MVPRLLIQLLDARPHVPLHRRNKPVSDPWNCLNESRRLGRISERIPQLLHRLIQPMIEVDKSVWRPQPLAQFFSRPRLARSLKQQGEHLNRLLRNPDSAAIPAKLSAFQIQLKKAEANDILNWRNRHFSPLAGLPEFSTVVNNGSSPIFVSRLSTND